MNEPNLKKKTRLMDKSIKEQKKVLVIATFFLVTLFFGSSYALLTNFKKLDNAVNITTGNLSVSITNTEGLLNLTGKLPETDASGLQNATTVPVTITNNGTMDIVKYEVKLVQDANQTSTLSDLYVKCAISEDGTNYKEAKKLKVSNETSPSDNIIYTGYILKKNNSKIIYIKIWIDEDAGDNGVNKNYYGSLDVKLYQNISINNLPKSTTMTYIANHDDIMIKDINFSEVNGTNNGNGLFLLTGTEDDTYPIYYYRGNVDNNNVYFAENCWKIVRTTSTGGLKLVYNGAATDVDGEKQCNQTTGTGTQLSVGTKAFNSSYNSPAYVGYSLPESSKRYSYSTQTLNSTTYYGSSVDPTTYKLVDPVLELNDTHRYSYKSADANATGIENDTGKVRYYYYKSSASGTSGTGYYIKFSKTKSIQDLLNEMLNESNSKDNPSTIQGVINTWWGSLDATYGSYLEDTEWCNDRSVASLGGWSPTGTLYSSDWSDNYLIFNEIVRYDQTTYGTNVNNIKNTNTPILTCSNHNDRLTVAKGNLTYPIGLLTYDEVAMAGARWETMNRNYYLYTNQTYKLLSPAFFSIDNAYAGYVTNTGSMDKTDVHYVAGVRPSLSLKPATQILGGDGSPEKPYIVTE